MPAPALSDAGWAAVAVSCALTSLAAGAAASPVGVIVVAFNLVVAWLLWRRMRAQAHAGIGQLVVALAAVVMGAIALAQAPPTESFGYLPSALFVAGGLGAMASPLSLGRSFAVLPSLRQVVTRGPYRYLRHPAYACELLMVCACCLAGGRWWSWWPLLPTVPLMVARIAAEERLLATSPEYQTYRDQVRYRMVPGVW